MHFYDSRMCTIDSPYKITPINPRNGTKTPVKRIPTVAHPGWSIAKTPSVKGNTKLPDPKNMENIAKPAVNTVLLKCIILVVSRLNQVQVSKKSYFQLKSKPKNTVDCQLCLTSRIDLRIILAPKITAMKFIATNIHVKTKKFSKDWNH